MHIFIDESGSFSGYHNGSLGGGGALCVPDCVLPKLTQKYLKLRPTLPQEKGEVKGRLLTEAQVNRVVELLIKNQAIFEVTVLDLAACRT